MSLIPFMQESLQFRTAYPRKRGVMNKEGRAFFLPELPSLFTRDFIHILECNSIRS
jgi:hypothetical protein